MVEEWKLWYQPPTLVVFQAELGIKKSFVLKKKKINNPTQYIPNYQMIGR